MKTAAAVSLVFPLVILALPILDTAFVILKRLKHRQPIYQADRWHFHHRFANIGYSQRRSAMHLYAWCISLSAFALAVRFAPNPRQGWDLVEVAAIAVSGVVALARPVHAAAARDPEAPPPAGGARGQLGRRATRTSGRLSGQIPLFT